MPTLSFDLHVHPGPSTAPRWGDGRQVWDAARAAGVRGFVWKAHERHTPELCRRLPQQPVRPFGSASLNQWASPADVIAAIEADARWIWGPTLADDGTIGWELHLPDWWPEVADWLRGAGRRLVLATGHLGPDGRAELAALAGRHAHLLCSVTHSLFVDQTELLALTHTGCWFEIDAYTYAVDIPGRSRADLSEVVALLREREAPAYFTSDGGQSSTGDPFLFGARILDRLAEQIGDGPAATLGRHNPEALVAWLDGEEA